MFAKYQIDDSDIRIAEFRNGFGQVGYSPVLPDGRRPYLGWDEISWLRDERMWERPILWSSRRSALRAARRQWKRSIKTSWTEVQD